ncbi:EPIDERMAL PATTERNING FACTOR protein [Trifolium repens]|nr:EPIDERMAL PATTERNING FACTOR protein [Trifolium repens]
MKGRFFCFMLTLQILSLVCAARRPFLSNHAQENAPKSSPPYTIESKKLKGIMGIEGMSKRREEENDRGVSKIGSSPPSCEKKCYGCFPCEATQVPSTTNHLGIMYANYEPESWKCKCGPSFYSP